MIRTRVGYVDEWHLDFHKAFCHEEFYLGAWLHQPAIMIASLFLDAGFESIRPIRYLMRGDGIE